jgi:formylglycine-generating enzyme required for sulfatase activity
MVLIPVGSFMMGSPPFEAGRGTNESPRHSVLIRRSFLIGVCQVSQDQYLRVIGENPSAFSQKNRGGDEHPVEMVSWDDALAFCKWLSALDTELSDGQLYRLPTEAEWEYACRAGNQTAYSFGDDRTRLGSSGWFKDNAEGATHPVGQLAGNSWGLYDMHGNVWEWCMDLPWREPTPNKLSLWTGQPPARRILDVPLQSGNHGLTN